MTFLHIEEIPVFSQLRLEDTGDGTGMARMAGMAGMAEMGSHRHRGKRRSGCARGRGRAGQARDAGLGAHARGCGELRRTGAAEQDRKDAAGLGTSGNQKTSKTAHLGLGRRYWWQMDETWTNGWQMDGKWMANGWQILANGWEGATHSETIQTIHLLEASMGTATAGSMEHPKWRLVFRLDLSGRTGGGSTGAFLSLNAVTAEHQQLNNPLI